MAGWDEEVHCLRVPLCVRDPYLCFVRSPELGGRQVPVDVMNGHDQICCKGSLESIDAKQSYNDQRPQSSKSNVSLVWKAENPREEASLSQPGNGRAESF